MEHPNSGECDTPRKPPSITTVTTTTTLSKWHNLPPDILTTLATLLDQTTGIATLRLRSTCHSWRTSVTPLHHHRHHHPTITFPLKTPSFTLHHSSLYLLSNPHSTFLIKKQTGSKNPTHFRLLNPLAKHTRGWRDPPLCNDVNLLDCEVKLVGNLYFVENFCFGVNIEKVVSGSGFFDEDDFVLLGLDYLGGLFIWRFGDLGWSQIFASERVFNDVISFNGKFYATADGKGRIVMIDSRLKPVDLVSGLVYGYGSFTSLVECDGGLYLVDREESGVLYEPEYKFSVFKLDDKGCFWDYERDLNDCVFFLGDDANFALSRKDYNGSVKNVIFFRDTNLGYDGLNMVFDMKTGTCCRVEENEEYMSLYWPPRRRFDED